MAIINFTAGDKLASLLAETGWYTLEIAELEAKSSTSGNSINFWTTFKVASGPLQGKEFKVSFNNKTKSFSMLNGQQFNPHTDLIPLYAAALNVDRSAVPDNFDTDTLKGKLIDGKVEKSIFDGVPGNSLIAFLPEGKGMSAAVPF